MRVVFDTNVFVSALVFPGGDGELALLRVLEPTHVLVLSSPILGELLRVLATKFSRDREELARVAVFLGEIAEVVAPAIRLRVVDDEPDNRILECAVAGSADVIVTGDKAMLALGQFGGVRIIPLREFLSAPGR